MDTVSLLVTVNVAAWVILCVCGVFMYKKNLSLSSLQEKVINKTADLLIRARELQEQKDLIALREKRLITEEQKRGYPANLVFRIVGQARTGKTRDLLEYAERNNCYVVVPYERYRGSAEELAIAHGYENLLKERKIISIHKLQSVLGTETDSRKFVFDDVEVCLQSLVGRYAGKLEGYSIERRSDYMQTSIVSNALKNAKESDIAEEDGISLVPIYKNPFLEESFREQWDCIIPRHQIVSKEKSSE